MINYPFSSIFINNREVELKKIISGQEIAQSDFEKYTFSFIHDWLNNEKEFRQKTSGSTGAPKEISISREQMIASALLTEEAIQLRRGLNALVCLDTKYIAGKMMVVRCFVTGMKIIAINPVANPLNESDTRHKIDFAAFVPYQIQEMLSSDTSLRLNKIQNAIIGGAVLDNSTREILQSYSCQFYASYGMTETVSHIALQKLNGRNSSELFQTLPGIQIKLDQRSCLIIKSPYLQGEICTNDIVDIISDKEFKWIGRYDNVINSGGIKVSPEKLEILILKFFRANEIKRSFFVAGLLHKKLGEQITLVVEGDKLSDQDIAKINIMFKHTFAHYEIPKRMLFKKVFDITETGKINRVKTIELIEK